MLTFYCDGLYVIHFYVGRLNVSTCFFTWDTLVSNNIKKLCFLWPNNQHFYFVSGPPTINGLSELIIENVNKQDGGTYKCVATNSVGSQPAHATVNIRGKLNSTIVMQSRGISQKSNMWHFQFSIWLKSSLLEVHFVENCTFIGPVVPKL